MDNYSDHIDSLISLLDEKDLEFIVQYGSSVKETANAQDLDLLAIYAGWTRSEMVTIGKIDMIVVTPEEFDEYLAQLDPVYCTEPLLTGTLEYGSQETLNEAKRKLKISPSNSNIISHQLRNATKNYLKTSRFAEQGALKEALLSLSFSISYRLFAEWYLDGKEPLPLAELIQNTRKAAFFEEIFEYIKTVKRDSSKANSALVQEHQHTWEQLLIEGDLL